MENFKKLYKIDVDGLLIEVLDHKEMFGLNPLRTSYEGSAHRDVKDILLRGPDLKKHSLDRLQNEITCISYETLNKFKAIEEELYYLLYMTKGVQLGRVILTATEAGKGVFPHIDEGNRSGKKFFQ